MPAQDHLHGQSLEIWLVYVEQFAATAEGNEWLEL